MSEPTKKVKSVTLLDAITLEATEVGTQAVASRLLVNTYESDQLNLACKYTTGAAETNNVCTITVWGYIGTKSEQRHSQYASATDDTAIKTDTANWIQLGTYDTVGGDSTFETQQLVIQGVEAATAYDTHFAMGITFSKIRIAASEAGVASNKGTLTIVALVQ
jgi:hypothetical protein